MFLSVFFSPKYLVLFVVKIKSLCMCESYAILKQTLGIDVSGHKIFLFDTPVRSKLKVVWHIHCISISFIHIIVICPDPLVEWLAFVPMNLATGVRYPGLAGHI